VQDRIATKYHFKVIGRVDPSPAHLFEFDDGYVFGIIDPHKHDFCEDCNRIRHTAEGMLIPYLYFDVAMSIINAIHTKDSVSATKIIKEVIYKKPKKNLWSHNATNQSSSRAFYQTGG
jgi:cyclic pyranopterin phosphate synthase